jgi:hypothetical protein
MGRVSLSVHELVPISKHSTDFLELFVGDLK